ncbi:MAG TPA: J domain-containing protein, partial [Rhizomicrobium sp.]|nr:J domain-containing protein [Rhizomicrobium sp.]
GAREFHFSFDDAASSPGGGGPAGFEDIFADLMGGGRRGAKAGQARAAKGEDFAAAVTVSFAEAATGGTRRVMLQNGEQIDIKIPVGVKDGQVVRVKGRGGAGRGGPNGDILLTVAVAPHPFMTRDGNDIRMDLPVTLKEAVAGGKVPVPTLTGTVSLSVPPNSNTGTVLRLKAKGIAAHGGTAAGDFYVRLVVTLPDKPDESLRAFVQGWSGDYDPRAKMR